MLISTLKLPKYSATSSAGASSSTVSQPADTLSSFLCFTHPSMMRQTWKKWKRRCIIGRQTYTLSRESYRANKASAKSTSTKITMSNWISSMKVHGHSLLRCRSCIPLVCDSKCLTRSKRTHRWKTSLSHQLGTLQGHSESTQKPELSYTAKELKKIIACWWTSLRLLSLKMLS